jgi:ribosomal protein L37AE/L43A
MAKKSKLLKDLEAFNPCQTCETARERDALRTRVRELEEQLEGERRIHEQTAVQAADESCRQRAERIRARTQHYLGKWTEVDANQTYRIMRRMAVYETAVKNIMGHVTQRALLICPHCGKVWQVERSALTPGSGWRLCESCQEAVPDPWAAGDWLAEGRNGVALATKDSAKRGK